MVEIENERFRLREFKEEDVNPLHRKLGKKKMIQYMSNIPWPYTKENAREWVEYCIESLEETPRTRIPLIIEIEGELGGSVDLSSVKPGHKATLGYWLGEEHQGNGHMTKSVEAIINYGFEELDLERIEATVHIENNPSRKVLERCGFEQETKLEKYMKTALGEVADAYLYAKFNDQKD